MFKLYQFIGGQKIEIIPDKDIYTVNELGEYQFVCDVDFSGNKLVDEIVFLEDLPISIDLFSISGNLLTSTKSRFFQDFFGFAILLIGNVGIKINIQIEKFKIAELEEILFYLWENNNKIFHIYFSKSTVKATFDNEGFEMGMTSKFIYYAQKFFEVFQSLFYNYYNSPHTFLRVKSEISDYNPAKINASSIMWLLGNLDSVDFGTANLYDSNLIRIGNSSALVNRIEVERGEMSFDNYENRVILGGFKYLLNKLRELKLELRNNLNDNTFSTKNFIDFRDFKRIPYLKLFDQTTSVEYNLNLLYQKFISLFKDARPIVGKPRITPIFVNKIHYSTAFKYIHRLYDYKINLGDEIYLLNLRKLSQLYEVYNYFKITDSIKLFFNNRAYSFTVDSIRTDSIPNIVSFNYKNVTIKVFYELKYPNLQNLTELDRIDKRYGQYYEPDFVIEITSNSKVDYIILDSKYTKYNTLRYKYLPDCIDKYVLNTGIKKFPFKKTASLVLIYPGDEVYYHVKSSFYAPQVILLPCKPKVEKNLNIFVKEVLGKYFPDIAS